MSRVSDLLHRTVHRRYQHDWEDSCQEVFVVTRTIHQAGVEAVVVYDYDELMKSWSFGWDALTTVENAYHRSEECPYV